MVATTSADASVERRIATHVVVLGMGDVSHGDEGVGVRVTEALRDLVPPGVRLAAHDGNGTDFPELEGATHFLVIDCADVGRAPGAVVVFDGTVLTPCVAAASFRDTSLVHYLVLAGCTRTRRRRSRSSASSPRTRTGAPACPSPSRPPSRRSSRRRSPCSGSGWTLQRHLPPAVRARATAERPPRAGPSALVSQGRATRPDDRPRGDDGG